MEWAVAIPVLALAAAVGWVCGFFLRAVWEGEKAYRKAAAEIEREHAELEAKITAGCRPANEFRAPEGWSSNYPTPPRLPHPRMPPPPPSRPEWGG